MPDTASSQRVHGTLLRWRLPALSPQTLTLLTCLAFTLFYNQRFWSAIISAAPPGRWGQLLGYGVIMTSLYLVVLLPLIYRTTVKPLLSLLILIAAVVSYFTSRYGTYFDTTMIDNALQTDPREAGELLTPGLALYLLFFAGLPILLLWRWPLYRYSWKRGLSMTARWWLGSFVILLVSVLLSYQSLSALMRNHRELRYLITPGNAIISTAQLVTATDARPDKRVPIAEDAARLPAFTDMPRLLVLVIGETVRAANWGLSTYSRQTTPRLADRKVINFSDVRSCGTNTAVSLPCMFSPIGRTNYDKRYIQTHESLLDILQRAAYRVIWIDNQSGCKGVCDRVERDDPSATVYPQLCDRNGCLDEVLIDELKRQLESIDRDTVIVLHMLGNHGPSYFQRYPEAFRIFTPACETAELSQCSREAIRNSYDNAILYTDSVLDELIEVLGQQSFLATALLYVSDHGESLGENGLYLHSLPYAIAPDEQTHVPMIWWSSSGFERSTGLDVACLSDQRDRALSHDNLFHSLLGLLGVESSIREADLDISQTCRAPDAPAPAQ